MFIGKLEPLHRLDLQMGQIAYRHRAPLTPSSPCLLLIHALAMSSLQWLEFTSHIPQDWGLLIPDCRAHGDSAKPEGAYSIDALSDDLAQLMDKLGWTRSIVAGCSMGGCIAQALAINNPNLVDKLILIDTTAHYGDHAASKWQERSATAIREGMEALLPFQLDRWFTNEFIRSNPDVVVRCQNVFLQNDPTSYAEVCKALSDVDLRPLLKNIDCRTLVIVAEHDYATPLSMALELNAHIARSKLMVLKDAKHFAPIERPAEVAAAIVDFVCLEEIGL